MRVFQRLKEAWGKFLFCYSATNNFSSFLSLIWFTKLYRFRKKSTKYKKYQNKFFSISLTAFPDRDVFIRIYAGDMDIFYEIFYKKIYELPESPEKCVIIDAGANVGFAALYFLHLMPGATIYCIEPDPDNFIFLQKNLKPEIESGKVKPVMAGLSGIDSFMNLRSSYLKYNTSLVGGGDEGSIRVATYSVATFMNQFNIDNAGLFKIDIEGSEENVFKGDISWLSNISEVIIEFHSKQIKKMCVEKFVSQGFNYLPHTNRKNTDVFHFKRG